MTNNEKLENEVYNERVNDLMQKFANDATEGGYSHSEIIPALCHQLITYVTEFEDAPRKFCYLMKMLADEFDEVMDEIDETEADND